MMNMKSTLLALGLTALALPAGAETAVPAKAAVCAACHGEGGGKPILPEYPILAGQYSNYLAHALHEYRDGKRKNIVMNAQAAALTDAEIKELALYFQKQAGPLYTPRIPLHKAKAR